MASDDGRLLLGSIFGFGFGIYTFLKGFRQYRKYRVVADTPATHIRSAPMGLVKIRGQARGEQTLLSPITRTPCYLFKVLVEEWHSDSEGGGSWKHVATDFQNVKFELQDASGNVLIDPANAELDLPGSPPRKVRSRTSVASGSAPVQAVVRGTPATDIELLQYVEQARMRHVGQMVGRGASLLVQATAPARNSPAQGILSALANPAADGDFAGQMMRMMLARKDPTGETSRAALEVWKHPQGSIEFENALLALGLIYARSMAPGKHAPDVAAVQAQIHARRDMALMMAASVAAAAEPQADPAAEQARQAAMAYGHEHPWGMPSGAAHMASGEFRFSEYCLVPGKTYDITGTCAENPSPRDEQDRNVILKGNNEPTFLISSRSEKELESWMWKKSLWMVLGGAALAVVCLAIILGKLGLF